MKVTKEELKAINTYRGRPGSNLDTLHRLVGSLKSTLQEHSFVKKFPEVKDSYEKEFEKQLKEHLSCSMNNGFCLNLEGQIKMDAVHLIEEALIVWQDLGFTIEEFGDVVVSMHSRKDTKEHSLEFRKKLHLSY